MKHLGYPAYFMTIIGVWYVLGAVALLVPRFPWLKEWAYAGTVFIYTGAVASRLAVGDRSVTLVGPIVLIGLVAASWSLRPSARSVLRLDKQRYAYAYFPFSH
jgi:DoxX-like family